MYAAYSQGGLSEETAQKWFCRFRSGNFNVKDAPRSGRPITKEVDKLAAKVEREQPLYNQKTRPPNNFKAFEESWLQEARIDAKKRTQFYFHLRNRAISNAIDHRL